MADSLIHRPVRDELDVAVVHVDDEQHAGGVPEELQELALRQPLRGGRIVIHRHEGGVAVGQHLLHDRVQIGLLRFGEQVSLVIDDHPIGALPRLRGQRILGQGHQQRAQAQQRRQEPFTTLHCWRPPF